MGNERVESSDHGSRGAAAPAPAAVRVRSRRSKGSRAAHPVVEPATRTVAVTHADTGVGPALVARLAARPDVRRVLALAAQRGERDDVTWRSVAVDDPAIARVLKGADAVVHLAAPLDTMLVDGQALVLGVQTVLTAAAAAGVPRAVVLSSAMVYGALADNPVPLDEDGPLRASSGDAFVGALLEVEALVQRARTVHPGLAVTVVRPAMVVGPGADSFLTRHFESPRLLVLKESDPHWQLCHVDDLAAALELAAVGGVEGVVTVGCEGFLRQDEVEAVAGLRRVELPARVAYATAERLHRLGVTPAPATELAYTAYPWVVPSMRLRAAGWIPVYDNTTALEELLAVVRGQVTLGGRRLGPRHATVGAAGATVAVLGTAAVVRQLRRQRRG